MKIGKFSTTLVVVLVLVIILAIGYWLIMTGFDAFFAFIGDGKQVVTAALAALIMGGVGVKLTMGKGKLAMAGQYEKIGVWAALLLSIMSAVTTTSGLALLFSANQTTGGLLAIVLPTLAGVGIQLSMLVYALRLGEGVSRLSPVRMEREDEHFDDVAEADDKTSLFMPLLITGLVVVGLWVTLGNTVMDLLGATWDSVYSGARNLGDGPKVLGPILLVAAIILIIRYGFVARPRTLTGLMLALMIYVGFLVFSSGFGYLSYFRAMQSEEVQAIDRDNHIETETASLVRKIKTAAQEDTRQSLIEARSGKDYKDLSRRVDALAALFVANKGKMAAELNAYKIRRDRIIRQQETAAQTVADRQNQLEATKLEVERVRANLQLVKQERDLQVPQYQAARNQALEEERLAREGKDGTGIKICGKICEAAKDRAKALQKRIDRFNKSVTDAEFALQRAKAKVVQAERALKTAKLGNGSQPVDSTPPPSIVDKSSFTRPRNEYNVVASRDALKEIARTCSNASQMLIEIGIAANDIPSCDISAVEVWLVRHAESKAALKAMEEPCQQTADEIQIEKNAIMEGKAADPKAIPPHLRARLAWVTRCLTVANTGSARMRVLADEVNRLESQYTSPGYDPRRVLDALWGGNRSAYFAIVFAVIIDLAILFAGFSANSYRGRELEDDPNLLVADQAADRIRSALDTAWPGAPHRAALLLSGHWEPRLARDIGGSSFTRKLTMDSLPPDVRQPIQLILDAAGPQLAKFEQRNSEIICLMHQRFVALITTYATAGAPKGGTTIRQADVLRSSDARGARSRSTITPIFLPAASNQKNDGSGDKKSTDLSRKIDLGPGEDPEV